MTYQKIATLLILGFTFLYGCNNEEDREEISDIYLPKETGMDDKQQDIHLIDFKSEINIEEDIITYDITEIYNNTDTFEEDRFQEDIHSDSISDVYQNDIFIEIEDNLLIDAGIQDNIPPQFAGLIDIVALSDTEVMLFWAPATDNDTNQYDIYYDICYSEMERDCLNNFIAIKSISGLVYNYKITGLTPSKNYYFLVRARDLSGNRDNNNILLKRELLKDAVLVSSGNKHTCALLSNGSVWCWGYNWAGQLGDGTNSKSGTPKEVIGISGVTKLSAGDLHTCGILSNSDILCWGNNRYGQLGDMSFNDSNKPVEVKGLTNVISISVGGDMYSSHSCALLLDKTIRCWGSNIYGQLGLGYTSYYFYEVVPVILR